MTKSIALLDVQAHHVRPLLNFLPADIVLIGNSLPCGPENSLRLVFDVTATDLIGGRWAYVLMSFDNNRHGLAIGPAKGPLRQFTPEPLDYGVDRIAAERQRQVTGEGYAPAHDDQYVRGELCGAAGAYLSAVDARESGVSSAELATRGPPPDWPWDEAWWKPQSTTRDLERAGALIAAELGRRKRAHDGFLALVVEACVAGGADRDHAVDEVGQAVPDFLREEGIEVGHRDHDWGVAGAAALADDLVLRHLEASHG